MATLEEMYEKVVSDDGEKKALAQAFSTREGAEAYLAEHGCEATPEELATFLKGKVGASGEVSDEALEGAAGGTWFDWITSVLTVGIGCGIVALVSYRDEKDGVNHTHSGHTDICDTI